MRSSTLIRTDGAHRTRSRDGAAAGRSSRGCAGAGPAPSRQEHNRAARIAAVTATVVPRDEAISRGFVHSAVLALVWLTFAVSGFVMTEPAPVDALLAGLAILLPVVGLVSITPPLAAYLALWCVAAATGFLAATVSRDAGASTIFTAISLYLYAASFVLAAFVARAPDSHARLIHSGWLVAAILAAIAALAGYFDLVPGAADAFTKFSRAAGPFKDPNVFGPFLVAPFLYGLHLVLNRPWYRALLPLASVAVLALAVLLSYSRGAWINLFVALVIYSTLAFVTARSLAQREKIAMLVAGGIGLVVMGTALVSQNDKIAGFLQERASLTQSYDVGPAGRFGGQDKAISLILENPLGIGAGQFTLYYHHEEVHNVFLSMFLNAGWFGGLTYCLMTGLTVLIGSRCVLRASPARPLFLVAYAAFIATAIEGVVIDTDHWRSFYILMALVWGTAFSPYADDEAGQAGGETVALGGTHG